MHHPTAAGAAKGRWRGRGSRGLRGGRISPSQFSSEQDGVEAVEDTLAGGGGGPLAAGGPRGLVGRAQEGDVGALREVRREGQRR